MSDLTEYQRAMARVSFALEPSERDLALLGDPERFRMYRSMVRSRLEGMAKVAFARTLEAVGAQAFAEAHARYLHEQPPASPLIRDVTARFAEFALGEGSLFRAAPPHARELLTFEHAKWCVAYQQAEQPEVGHEGVRELDFEGVPVWNPVLRLLALEHTVHEPEPRAQQTLLLVYRPRGVEQVRWYASDRFFFSLAQHAIAAPWPLAEAVRAECARSGVALDEALLERLSASIALAIERGVLVGSR